MNEIASQSIIANPLARPRQHLSLLDSTCIIVGIIIGASIYEASPSIAYLASQRAIDWTTRANWQLSPEAQSQIGIAAIIAVWTLGGLLALVGALCYAELATANPREGGTYIFLHEAFGRSVAFSFAWVEFWIIRPGNVGAIAYVFARYAAPFAGNFAGSYTRMTLAAAAIAALSLLNLLGVRLGAWTQNLMTIGKVVGLVIITAVAFLLPVSEATTQVALEGAKGVGGNLTLAMILVMFAYGGWSDMSYVAAEVRHPERNIARALVLGTLAVSAIYLMLNLAFAWGLGLDGFINSKAVAADVLSRGVGEWGGRAISLLICLSCLGAINGMIFTGSRVYFAVAAEHRLFAWLGAWNHERGIPSRSLLVQAVATVGIVIAFGLYENGFERLVVFTGPFFWGYFAMVGLALVVIRDKEPSATGTFRVPLYPVTPLVFMLSSLLMAFSALQYALGNLAWEATWAGAVLAAGLLVYLFDQRRTPR
jgi:amino acid transporter